MGSLEGKQIQTCHGLTMSPLIFQRQEGLKILCRGAHCDAIAIGCGGTVMRPGDEYTALKTKWGVFTFTSERDMEARKSAVISAMSLKRMG